MTSALFQRIRSTIIPGFLRALLVLSLIALLAGVARAVVPETILHTFGYDDGAYPQSGLVQDGAGNYYGTTGGGGSSSYYGTVFKYSPSTDELTTLHAFGYYGDGAYPYGGLLLGSDGMLYGTTNYGGPAGWGTAFRIDTDGTDFTVLHAFDYTNGGYPYAGLLQGSDGQLYGTTEQGGANGTGTVFQLSLDGSSFDTIHAFGPNDNTDGINPHGGLLEGPDGNLYGTTYNGGIASTSFVGTWGTVFKLETLLPILKSFAPSSGSVALNAKVTINGVNLNVGSVTVTIGGVAQTIVSNTGTKLIINLASGTPTGPYPVLVTTANGTATSSKLYTVLP